MSGFIFFSKPSKLRPFVIQIIDWCMCFHLGHQLPCVIVYIYLNVRSCFIMLLWHLSPILTLFHTCLQHMTLSVGVLRVFSFWLWVILSKMSRDPVTKCLICEGIIHFRLIRWNHFFVMGTVTCPVEASSLELAGTFGTSQTFLCVDFSVSGWDCGKGCHLLWGCR